MTLAFVRPSDETVPTCEAILRSLPEWFGDESALLRYAMDVQTLPTFVVQQHDKTIGFITLKQHFPHSAEIHCLAVHRAHHRTGAGRTLVLVAEHWLMERDVKYLQVKTLGPSAVSSEYEGTRKFYEAVGFVPLEEFKTLWNAENPCLLMVKLLCA